MILLYDDDVLTNMVLMVRRRMQKKAFLQINYMCSKKEGGGSGTRMMAEIKHYANRMRVNAIIVNSVPKAIKFYESMRFTKCDFHKLLGNTFKYIVRDPLN
jgi:CRISPR/Cas system-associated endonuclease/helicase Cas3